MATKKITRAQVRTELNQINKQISEIEPKAVRPTAATANKHIEGVGCIQDMESYESLIKAQAFMNDFTARMDKAAQDLGLDNPMKSKYQGFDISVWKNDIKDRVAYLQARAALKNLREAKAILERNLSEDDIFAMEMDKVSSLISK